MQEKEEKAYKGRKETFDANFEDARKIASWKPYDQNAKADWFDPEWMFGVRDGFHVVIGNPPYVQLQKAGGRLGRLYASCNFESFIRTGDIYCLFYEKANQLLKSEGHVCFITSNKWMRAAYGKRLRDYFVQHTQPVQLLDMGPDVFDATVDTNILLFQNAASDVPTAFRAATLGTDFDKQTDNIAGYLNDNGVVMEVPTKDEPWAVLSSAERALKRKIANSGKLLGEYIKGQFYMGIKTGLNDAFVVDKETADKLIVEHPSSAKVLKPFLRGRDVKRWQVKSAEQYLIKIESSENQVHPWSGQPPQEAERIFANIYPAIHAHFEPFREHLIKRYDQGKYFWELRACAYWEKFERPKIVYPDIYQHQSFTVDTDAFYCGNTCYFIPTAETWLCGLLNSKTVEWFYSLVSNRLGSGGLRAFSTYMKEIPIPNIKPAEKALISKSVSQILDTKHADPEADVVSLENEIDRMVYALYMLTAEEIAIVEENVNFLKKS